ncbi:asparagine synthase C-terminal domain-containing protein [Aliiglaciecola sp. 2_MG-2023]|uniref:asparagine synthase-related protein n=1 Tax=unclassified Aliiglaciecola TaxID=2593648 RepID=UPI0026E4218E|nr:MULTISPECIES: asparagine synthase C-terminal domain-containing protein [unclassified Aliiglaciecola]MDO6712891.1 asparagine synthase C-terminal domain-containing protein [Aliiglaciecola sp. 2_MG-2023]MDO6752873.1 asparagine synthase C-terminal domain-containing protein [Aliiglaciecola sp. 1_MG-2023]
MNTLFALFGSKAPRYFEAIQGYYENSNKQVISDSYSSIGGADSSVFLGKVADADGVLKTDTPVPLKIVSAGRFCLKNAPLVCDGALKDRDLWDLIDSDYSKTIEQLDGDFTLISWHPHAAELRFCSAAFNPRTLFYGWLEGCFLVTTDLQMITTLLTPKVDNISILQWLAGRPDPNRSMFSNIDQLPFAHSACLSAENQLTVRRFWDIQPNHSLKFANEVEYEQAFYDVLKQSIAGALPLSSQGKRPEPIFSQMSGGMDSTSITSILHSLSEHGEKDSDPLGFELHSISHTYRNTQSCDEIEKIDAMRDFLKLQHSHFVELDQFTNLSFAQVYPTQLQNPGVVASPKYQQEAEMIQRLGGHDLFTGNGGDEMCWGHSFAYRDRLASGDLGVIKEVFNSAQQLGMSPMRIILQVLVKPLLPQSLLSLLGKQPVDADHFPQWLGPQQQAMLKSVEKHNPFAQSKQWAKRARYEGLFTTSTFNSMRSYQHVCDPLGIAVHHPFFNKQLAEFSFAVPQKLHIQGRYPKYLLRKAMDSHLPESVCWDQNKTVFDQHFANLVRANKTELRELLSHPGLQDLGLVDNDILLASFDKVVASPKGSLNVDLLYAILTQSWYQTHML